MSRLPVIFFGHGSPMIALETNDTTRAWKAMGDAVGKPKAILCVSAHWLTRGVAVTAMSNSASLGPASLRLAERLSLCSHPSPRAQCSS